MTRASLEQVAFSTRPQRFGGGTDVSYGVVLSNDTPGQDALNLSVLVNFVGPNDHLIGSATSSIDAIPAGGQYALGSSMSFPGAAPIVRLETVIQVGSHQPSSLHYPVVSNIYLEPGFDAAWLGAVDGEISNVDPAQVLRYTGLSAVVFDASGNVIGGGTGTAFASLPPGAREFFKATSGFDAIPLGQAASAMVSLTPTWAN